MGIDFGAQSPKIVNLNVDLIKLCTEMTRQLSNQPTSIGTKQRCWEGSCLGTNHLQV